MRRLYKEQKNYWNWSHIKFQLCTQPDPNKRLRFCNWVLEKVNAGELDAKELLLATRRGFIYMDRCVHKITGITVTEKRNECLRATAVWRPVKRQAGRKRQPSVAVNDSVSPRSYALLSPPRVHQQCTQIPNTPVHTCSDLSLVVFFNCWQ